MSKPNHTDSIRAGFLEIFTIDARSLAVLRICIAAIILINLLFSFGSLETFYGEDGVLPRGLSQDVVNQQGSGFWSVYWLSDSMNWMWIWVGVNVVASVCLLLGFQTFLATAICLILAWSMQVRNPLVLTAGDVLLRMVLFWGLFLPWGSCWSIDCRKFVDPRPAKWRVTSIATGAIMVQLASVYFFSGMAKLQGSWDENALVKSFNLEMYTKPLGTWLAGNAEVLQWLAPVILVLEVAGPILLFLPWIHQYWRGMMMALMWLMHLGIWLTMSIGIFSVVAVVTWVIFVPSAVWNGLMDIPKGFESDQVEELEQIKNVWRWMAAPFLVLIILINVANMSKGSLEQMDPHSTLNTVANATMTQQEFRMFANPPEFSPWPKYSSTLNNSNSVNLFSVKEGLEGLKKPASVFSYMRSQNWRRYHFNLIHRGEIEPPLIFEKLRKRLLTFQVENWNRRRPESENVKSSTLTMIFDELENGKLNGKSSTESWAQMGQQ